MSLNELLAISPVDGRYHKTTKVLSEYFSEYALISYRVEVEIEYFLALMEIPIPQLKGLPDGAALDIRRISENFSEEDARTIKKLEKITNHDVKAVEYFLRNKFDELGLGAFKEFIHFGLTSQDINNTALPMMICDSLINVYFNVIKAAIAEVEKIAVSWQDVSMLARTHGQPASPTKVGKELRVFTERLSYQLEMLESISFTCKFGGATGNFNAHVVAFPEIDWSEFADNFCENKLGLLRQQTTTQIEHYDELAALFDNLKRINTILIDFCRDMWTYISMDYFKQKIKAGEVGSSAMPHKVNPIDFENAEGNFGFANAIFEHLSAKLPISRLQRDLTDSTVTRTIGLPFAHTLIAIQSFRNGISKLLINEIAIHNDLDKNWAVITEAIQTILRREGYKDPYNALKELSRTNKIIGREELHEFIDSLDIRDEVKNEMKKISPENYTGIA